MPYDFAELDRPPDHELRERRYRRAVAALDLDPPQPATRRDAIFSGRISLIGGVLWFCWRYRSLAPLATAFRFPPRHIPRDGHQ